MSLPRSVVLMAGCAVGLLGAVIATGPQRRRRALERWTRQFRGAVGRALDTPSACGDVDEVPSLAPLRGLLMGASKSDVLSALGPPPATTGRGPSTLPSISADIWYYPLDLRRHLAVAIRFEGQYAAAIDHLAGPR